MQKQLGVGHRARNTSYIALTGLKKRIFAHSGKHRIWGIPQWESALRDSKATDRNPMSSNTLEYNSTLPEGVAKPRLRYLRNFGGGVSIKLAAAKSAKLRPERDSRWSRISSILFQGKYSAKPIRRARSVQNWKVLDAWDGGSTAFCDKVNRLPQLQPNLRRGCAR